MTILQRLVLVLAALAAAGVLAWVWRWARDPWTQDPDSPFGAFTPDEWTRYRQQRRL